MRIKISDLSKIIKEELESTIQEISLSQDLAQDSKKVIEGLLGENSVSLVSSDGKKILFTVDDLYRERFMQKDADLFREEVKNNLLKMGYNIDFVAVDNIEGKEVIEIFMKY